MSGGTKRNSDTLNTIGIVVVGICGAVLAYVSIALLQAFYMNDTSDVQKMADYGGQDNDFQRGKANELTNITQCSNQMGTATTASKHVIRIDDAMKKIVDEAKNDPSMLVPELGRAEKTTIQAKFGRPVLKTAPAAPPSDGAAAPAAGAAGAPAATPAPTAPAAPATPTAPSAPGAGAGSGK
jgi:hypothetical protein